jgi:D-glycero-alpha-D-manno-heptose 1-phosphate guanylyltransferase
MILAGGQGTRLRSIVNDVPKPIAPINGTPFLQLLLNEFKNEFENIILCTGYKAAAIHELVSKIDPSILVSAEATPLGTGGAVKQALQYVKSNEVVIMNGDTFLEARALRASLSKKHKTHTVDIAAKTMLNSGRYGVITECNNILKKLTKRDASDQNIVEKINIGFFRCCTRFLLEHLPNIEKFDFEKDFIQLILTSFEINVFEYNGYFIDIGIPEDYKKFCDENKAT